MPRQGWQCSKHIPDARTHGLTFGLLTLEEGWNLILRQQDDLGVTSRRR
jgi:hypothetical protein